MTAVVRLRADPQLITDAEAFRAQFRAALKNAEDQAVRAGYTAEDTRLATFATVAFLDESVLNSGNPALAEWARRPLQEEIFGGHVGGEIFFRSLDRLLERSDSPELADAIEVFALLLRLGFRGRFSAGGTAEVRAYAARAEEKIRRIRGTEAPLSPSWEPGSAQAPAVPDRWQTRLLWIGAFSVGGAALLFLVFTLLLRTGSAELLRLAEGIRL
jgi:type VI secretion system protein ImpK